jgi:hypothetical protein
MARLTFDDVSFEYPDDWTVDETDDEIGWSVSIQSPGSAFALIAFRPDAEDPAQLADETLVTLMDEYPGLDHVDRVERIAGRMAIGHDVDFIALDATVTCRTRCLETTSGPMLLMLQFGERDPDELRAGLERIASSLEIADE